MLCKVVLLLNWVAVLSTVTHLVLQNDDIYTKDRSEYDLKEYSSLQKVLEQDELVKTADSLLGRLEIVKRNIIDDAPLLNSEDKVGENDCLESGLLSDFDFSILPALEREYEGHTRFDQYMCRSEVPNNVPDCTKSEETFFIGDYRHIPGVIHITEKAGSPTYSLLPFVPTDDIALFGHCLHRHLNEESENWHVYLGASFYWRLQGNDAAALQCIFKSLYYAQFTIDAKGQTDSLLVTLANLLSNAGHDSDAALVMEHSALIPYLQQLKLWSAGNLYTLSEQYKLSLDLYNETLKLGPFPLADERLSTMECYSSVIQRMEKQNNALRATLQKLRERHELETRYIGIQERMFSNLRNSTLPAHIIQQITTTEDAVRNTHKLVLEQQEIQNTLSPNKYKQQSERRVEVVVDDLEKLLETKNNKKQKSGNDIKKDINWIKSTRLKLEELVEQIKNQLSDPTDVPIVYTYEDGFESSEDLDDEEREKRRQYLNEEEETLLEELLDPEAEVIPPGEGTEQVVQEAKPDTENVEVKLSADIFPNKEQVKVQFKNLGTDNDCEVARGGENDSWYHLKCKITGDVKEKLDKELKIVIREQSASSATIELISDGSAEIFIPPYVQSMTITERGKARKVGLTTAPLLERPAMDQETLTKLITEHLQTRDIFETMKNIRKENIKPNLDSVENAVEMKFGEDSWVLRLFKVDTSPRNVVRLEMCDQYTPIFSHGDPYVPLMTSLFKHHHAIQKALKPSDHHHPFSPDCATHMDLDNCYLCYDDLSGVNREEHDVRHILEDFPLSELELVTKNVRALGAAIDAGLRKDPNNWVLYHLAAMYHRTFTFDLGPAMQCTRRALAVVDLENRPVPLLTLANLLHQGRNIPDATVIVLELLATDPNMFLYHVETSVLQVSIGRPSGQFRAAMDSLNLAHSPLADHLLNSLFCYYDILKEDFKPPYKRIVHSKRISRDKKHPPFTKPHKAPVDGEIWRLEHHEGITVDVTWVR
ncbi:uncharacterized protein LOC134813567 [Bolinopsis microptera]|uniref:uncharacterized protein LOC134813567 n=1 Tax=Bolinopsis microptera TaxID=2820187 RepID=UPI00307A24B1